MIKTILKMIDDSKEHELAPREKKLLPQGIREGLNAIRAMDLPFHIKSERLASILEQAGCTSIEAMDCDVCVTDFDPEYFQRHRMIYPDNYPDLSPDEQETIFLKMRESTPKQAKVRIEARTKAGYFTWCFGCEQTMCFNEVDYPENPDWDQIHRERAREFLLLHPELPVSKFLPRGSTRNRISINVISPDPELKVLNFDQDDFHIYLHPLSRQMLQHRPDVEDLFEPLEPSKR